MPLSESPGVFVRTMSHHICGDVLAGCQDRPWRGGKDRYRS